MVSRFSIILLIIATVMVASTIRQFAKKRITASWAMFWSGIWVVGSTLTFFSGWLDDMSEYLIGAQGRTLVLEGAVLVIFIIVYKLFMRQQQMRSDMSKLVEEIAKRDARKK